MTAVFYFVMARNLIKTKQDIFLEISLIVHLIVLFKFIESSETRRKGKCIKLRII
jgi:hypothetical protein